MGHDISLHKNKKRLNCFPVVGEGNYQAETVDGQLAPKTLQDSLYITYNLAPIYDLALSRIGREDIKLGSFLDKAQVTKVLPVLEALFDELIQNPKIYKPLEPDNGWGSYRGLCDKIYTLIVACRTNPTAIIHNFY